MKSPALLLPVLCVALTAHAAPSADTIADGFASPPQESRPESWFHLIGGNVGKAGLTADLEAVQGAGLQGIHLFHGNFGGPWPKVEPQITCLSADWDGMISHAANEAQRLGLQFTMQNCPGWAMAGGPWIKPENAMRHLVWSRTAVTGGSNVIATLPTPQPSREDWRDYRDVTVIAFPTPAGDDGVDLVPTEVTSSLANLPWADVIAGKDKATLTVPPQKETWVEVRFAAPVTLRSLELPPVEKLARRRNFDPGAVLRVQAIGDSGLTDVSRHVIPRGNYQEDRPLTLAVPDATARGFRITFDNKFPLEVSALRFSSAARLDDWQGQAGFVLRSLERHPAPVQDKAAWVDAARVVDLTDKMKPDGSLMWQAPAGKWTVLRFGHVNTGARNGPAPKEATGFECDKLSTAGADAHFAGYIGRISAPGGPADGGRLKGMVIDSWECHTQTWTPAMEKEFNTRRGYALRSWMPALAGWVVNDPVTSERFLRDWRATLNDLLVGNFYGTLVARGRERGLKLSFESGPGDVPTGDILQYYGMADVPMCEFWWPNDPHAGGLETKPMRPAVSAAHVYGKPRIAAEAFTNIDLRWNEHLFMLKHLADRHFAQGLTHLVFHTYTHNPRIGVVPGSSFGAFIGTPFLRGQTWWKYMPRWTEYLARCQFLLEQGKPVTDVLWYLGDDFDHKPRQDEPFPAGYQYDYVNADALTKRISVANGQLTTPEGVAWKLLILPNQPRLTADTLTKLRDLVKQGATVVGLPSFQNPTLVGGAAEEKRFAALARELWGDAPTKSGERKLGTGRLIWGGDLGDTLNKLGIAPDVTGAVSAMWCHREINGTNLYFIAAGRLAALQANLSFRSGGQPEFWDPLTGTSRPVPVFEQKDGRTVVALDLPATGSVFLMFRPGAAGPAFTRVVRDGNVLMDAGDASRRDTGVAQPVQGLPHSEPIQPWVEPQPASFEFLGAGKQLLAWQPGTYQITRSDKSVVTLKASSARTVPLTGAWTLSFPSGWDAPERVVLPALQPWSTLDEPAARSFSGTATYSCTVDMPAPAAGQRVLLDLGRVDVIAEVTVNGKPAATLWGPPFRTDITSFLKPGANQLEVKVTNPWFNRLAYDESLPEAQRKTWTIKAPPANAPVQPAGITGPVTLQIGQVLDVPAR